MAKLAWPCIALQYRSRVLLLVCQTHRPSCLLICSQFYKSPQKGKGGLGEKKRWWLRQGLEFSHAIQLVQQEEEGVGISNVKRFNSCLLFMVPSQKHSETGIVLHVISMCTWTVLADNGIILFYQLSPHSWLNGESVPKALGHGYFESSETEWIPMQERWQIGELENKRSYLPIFSL